MGKASHEAAIRSPTAAGFATYTFDSFVRRMFSFMRV